MKVFLLDFQQKIVSKILVLFVLNSRFQKGCLQASPQNKPQMFNRIESILKKENLLPHYWKETTIDVGRKKTKTKIIKQISHCYLRDHVIQLTWLHYYLFTYVTASRHINIDRSTVAHWYAICSYTRTAAVWGSNPGQWEYLYMLSLRSLLF